MRHFRICFFSPGKSSLALWIKIIEPFRSTKPEGLGLGLSISRSIIEAHHGRLDIERHAQRGITFYFVLPTG